VHGMLRSAETSREPQDACDGGTAAEAADSVGQVLACGHRQLRAVTTWKGGAGALGSVSNLACAVPASGLYLLGP
jgi:hypothetical protein